MTVERVPTLPECRRAPFEDGLDPRPRTSRPPTAAVRASAGLHPPDPDEKRISRRPRVAMFTGLFALGIVATIAFAVFVLPIGASPTQDIDLEQRQAQLEELQRVNNELQAETMRLDAADGIREAPREDYGYVDLGEERATVLPLPPLPTDLPDGWPYNVITQIIDARTAGP